MIQVKEFNIGFSVIKAVEIEIQNFKTGSPTINAVMWLHGNSPIANIDGKTIGINFVIPEDVIAEWIEDDAVIENYVLQQAGLARF